MVNIGFEFAQPKTAAAYDGKNMCSGTGQYPTKTGGFTPAGSCPRCYETHPTLSDTGTIKAHTPEPAPRTAANQTKNISIMDLDRPSREPMRPQRGVVRAPSTDQRKVRRQITVKARHEPIGYTYEADVHCPACTRKRFPTTEGVDREGNQVGAIAPWDETSEVGEYCADCGGEIAPPSAEYLEDARQDAEVENHQRPHPGQGRMFGQRLAMRADVIAEHDAALFEQGPELESKTSKIAAEWKEDVTVCRNCGLPQSKDQKFCWNCNHSTVPQEAKTAAAEWVEGSYGNTWKYNPLSNTTLMVSLMPMAGWRWSILDGDFHPGQHPTLQELSGGTCQGQADGKEKVQAAYESMMRGASKTAEMDLRTKLVMAVTEYDRKQEGKPGYNMYALPQYLGAVTRLFEEFIDKGVPFREAVLSCFSGRLATAVLKAGGEKAITSDEARGRFGSKIAVSVDDAYRAGMQDAWDGEPRNSDFGDDMADYHDGSDAKELQSQYDQGRRDWLAGERPSWVVGSKQAAGPKLKKGQQIVADDDAQIAGKNVPKGTRGTVTQTYVLAFPPGMQSVDAEVEGYGSGTIYGTWIPLPTESELPSNPNQQSLFARRMAGLKVATAVTPGYYTVGPNGSPLAGPFDTISVAQANLNGAAAIEFKSGVEDPEWDALRGKQFPYGMNTVNGSKTATEFSQSERDKLADSGAAEPDGSFPIRNSTDLEHAKEDLGRAGDKPSDRAHINERARALGEPGLGKSSDIHPEEGSSWPNEDAFYEKDEKKDDDTKKTASTRMDTINQVLEHGVYGDNGKMVKIDGMVLDATTASMLKTIYDALNSQEARDKFDRIPFKTLVDFGWKQVR